AAGVQDDELGQLVRMEFGQSFFQRGDTLARGLHDDLPLGVAFDAALPAIDREHRRQNVHARREFLVDQRARNLFGALVVRDGRKHHDNVTHELYFLTKWCTFVPAWRRPILHTLPAARRSRWAARRATA